MAETIFVNHIPNTYKAYHGLDNNGKVGWYVMFLDSKGQSRPVDGGKIYPHRQNAYARVKRLNHPVKHAIKKTGACEAYYDGYTLSVCEGEDDETGKDVYTLSVQVGYMPPHFQQDFKTVEEAEEEIRDRSAMPLYLDWTSVDPE
jgi:hypothetical protein